MQRTPAPGRTDSRISTRSASSTWTTLGFLVFGTWAATSCGGGKATEGTQSGGDTAADETASGKPPSESSSANDEAADEGGKTTGTSAASTQGTNSTAVDASTGNTSTAGTSAGTTSANTTSTTADATTEDEQVDASGESGGVVACDPSAAPAVAQLGLETVVQDSALTILVHAAQPPGSEDWYLVDALGYVRVFTNGMLQPTPFLDVSAEMQNSTFTGSGAPSGGASNYDERGLLSIAFPPDYATSGKFYVALIPTSGSAVDHDLVLEYTRSAENPLVADPATRRAILDLEPGGMGYSSAPGVNLAKYHNGSTVLFGPDGMLYVGMGDGGGECNSARPGTPQETNNPYGKILRLDPNAEPPHAAAGNPFAADGDARVLHWGLRNPFRFSFDSATGDLYIGDVGQWNHEEISFAPAGAQGVNFGWPDYEGDDAESCATNIALAQGATHTSPVFDLPHTNGGAQNLLTTIVGGAVYRGTAIAELRGAYLFAEFYPNRPVRALYQCGEQTSEITTIEKRCDPNQPNVACFVSVGGAPALAQVAAIVEGNDGELYIPANGNALLKIVPAP